MKCRVCQRPLSGPGDIGPVCAKHRAEAMQPHLPDVRPPVEIDLESFDFDPDTEVVDFDALRGLDRNDTIK